MQADQAIMSIVHQVNHLLEQIDPADYRRPLAEFNGSTLGQHFRHIVEFFQCLDKGAGKGTVDYASRERNLMYEENPDLTREAFEIFADALPLLDKNEPVMVRAEYGSDERPEYGSTIGRELLFVYDHAIHHLAIIKIGLNCQCPYVELEKDLGVSPSTIKARQAKGN